MTQNMREKYGQLPGKNWGTEVIAAGLIAEEMPSTAPGGHTPTVLGFQISGRRNDAT